MGKGADSILPEDIEARLANVQEKISGLERQIITLNDEIGSKNMELNEVNSRLETAKSELDKTTTNAAGISAGLADRETVVAQKESTLNVYANALEEKEKKINKYLAIFENMKDVIK